MDYDCIHVYSGLNNKLVPLLSLLRICKKKNKQILCHWETNGVIDRINKEGNHFLSLFENINEIKFIDINSINNLKNNSDLIIVNKNGSDRDRNSIQYNLHYKPDSKLYFNHVVHAIHFSNDDVIHKYVPYPRVKVKKNKFIDELREMYKLLVPKEDILLKVNNMTQNFTNVLGLHIRTTDTTKRISGEQLKDNLCGVRTGGFTKIDYTNVFNYISNFLIDNPEWKVYISCDCIEIEREIIKKFGEKILYFDYSFGDTYNDKFDIYNGLKNSISEMYILSKCTKFLGTPGSSFSFSVWLLRTDEYLDFWCKNPWN